MHNQIVAGNRNVASISPSATTPFMVQVVDSHSKVIAEYGPVIGVWAMRELAEKLADENPNCMIAMRRMRADNPRYRVCEEGVVVKEVQQ